LLTRGLADNPARAQDGEVVAEMQKLVQPMRDIDDGDAGLLQVGDNLKERIGLDC
jgi:hypothetical protein